MNNTLNLFQKTKSYDKKYGSGNWEIRIVVGAAKNQEGKPVCATEMDATHYGIEPGTPFNAAYLVLKSEQPRESTGNIFRKLFARLRRGKG